MRDRPRESGGGWPSTGDGGQFLPEERQRFIASFPKQCDSIELLLKTISARGPKGSAEPLRQMAHRVAADAGAVGFPNVSERASELEMLAAQADKGFSLEVARGQLEALRETFARELASPQRWEAPVSQPDAGVRILVVDGSVDERQAVTDYLQLAGYDPIALADGEGVLEAARQHQPGAILLEADLPGALDGYSVCRMLKADPQLAAIPVIFVTVRLSLDDKLAGLTLGADDYLLKPVDPRELLLRIDMVLHRPRTSR
jgi:CheY-like chemotaxis protein